jgi:Coenzyme PQQ synthesis protein D (PqqD)
MIVQRHLPTNRIFELNDTGMRVWELIAQGHDVAAAVQLAGTAPGGHRR